MGSSLYIQPHDEHLPSYNLPKATHSASELQSALSRVQVATGATDAQMKALNRTLTQTADATGVFSKVSLASFAAEMYSSGIRNPSQINEMQPLFTKAANAKLMKYQFGSASTMAMLMGAEKFSGLKKGIKTSVADIAKLGGITNVQERLMKNLDSQLKRASTNFDTLASTIGSHLIPVTTRIMTKIGDFSKIMKDLAEKHPKIVNAVFRLVAVAAGTLMLGGALTIINAGILGLQLVFGPCPAVFKLIGPRLDRRS